MLRIKDLLNKQFGKWVVIKFSHLGKQKQAYWICQCLCGSSPKAIIGTSLTIGHTTSCGCVKTKFMSTLTLVHGLAKTKFHTAWCAMNGRCNNPNNPRYPQYGGRGIKVCDRWSGEEGFLHFMEDMYESYLKHIKEFGEKQTTLDRYPNINGNYELSNCKWSTWKEQIRNRRISSLSVNYDEHLKYKNKIIKDINRILWTQTINSKLFEEIVGCSVSFFREYIESQFSEGMTWKNRGKGSNEWQLDHIIGINNFDLSKEEDRKKCFHYTNYQPLWDGDHLKKSRLRKNASPNVY